jgi:hypothetical protein
MDKEDRKSSPKFPPGAASKAGMVAACSASPRASVADLLPTSRSRVGNGRDLLPDIDGRSATARRYKEVLNAIIADQGGADRLSETRLQLVRRFAAASVLAEKIEARIVEGQEIDLAEHAQLSSSLVRLAQRIGIDRRARNVTPTLAEYLEQRASEQDNTDDDGDNVIDVEAEEPAS